jgi:NAD(P)-dependent dehydrogenase (short-subunit alcohol dehydrogenase family)
LPLRRVAREQVVTVEGNEATFTGNHLGHFLLTQRLLPLLRTTAANLPSGAVRVISVSSSAHLVSRGFDWNDLQSLTAFTPVAAHANAKLANILFTRALAKRVSGEGIVAHAMHPGLVGTNFASHGDEATQAHFEAKKDLAATPRAAAETLLWLATAAEPGHTSGGYFHERAPAECSTAAQDDAAAERLWTESKALIARAGV